MMIATGPNQGLPPVSLFHVMRTAIIGGEVKVHLARAWVMMLGPYTKFLNHRLHRRLKEESYFGGLLNQRLPCIMVGQTL